MTLVCFTVSAMPTRDRQHARLPSREGWSRKVLRVDANVPSRREAINSLRNQGRKVVCYDYQEQPRPLTAGDYIRAFTLTPIGTRLVEIQQGNQEHQQGDENTTDTLRVYRKLYGKAESGVRKLIP